MAISASARFAAVTIISTLICAAQNPQSWMPESTAARILEQATWAPTTRSIDELQRKGFNGWFADQVAAPVTIYPNEPMLGADVSRLSTFRRYRCNFLRMR